MEALVEKIAKIKKSIDSKATPETLKPRMKEQLAKLESELEEKKAEAAAKADIEKEKTASSSSKKDDKKETEKKKSGRPKGSSSKKKEVEVKPKRKFKAAAPKKKEESTEPDCDELLDKFKKAKANRKKSAKNAEKVSVSEKIGNDLADAVNKAIKNTPVSEIKEEPKVYIAKYERLEKVMKDVAVAFKAVLGDDFDKQDLLKPLHEAVAKIISDIKKKTGK